MSTSGGEISIDISGNKAKLDSVLRALESELKRAASAAGTAADAIGDKLGAGQSRAAKEALAHARAEATLKATTGDTVGAINGLRAALVGVDSSSVAAIRAETQLARLQLQLASDTGTAKRALDQGAQGALEFASKLGLAATAAGAASALVGRAQQGFNLGGAIQETKTSIGILLGSQEKANKVFDDGAAFGDKYKVKLSEINVALGSLGPLLRTSTASTQQQLEVLTRLQTLRPGAAFADAAFSAKELASLDYTSIAEQFNISKTAARGLRDEIAGGADVFAVLDRYLTANGVSVGVLEARTQGAAGATRSYEKAQEDLNLALGKFAQGPGIAALDTLTKITSSLTNLATLGTQSTDFSAGLAKSTKDFTEYQQQLAAFDAAIKQQSGGNALNEAIMQQLAGITRLTEAEYGYVKALEQKGVSEQAAIARVQTLGGALNQLASLQTQAAAYTDTETATKAYADLFAQIERIGAISPAAEAQVAALTTAFARNAITSEQYHIALDGLEQSLTRQATASAQSTAEDARHASALTVLSAASRDTTDATANVAAALQQSAAESLLDQNATQQLATAKNELEARARAAANGLLASGEAGAATAARLASSSNQVDVLTAAYYRLAAAQAAAKANAGALNDQRAGERDGGSSRTAAEITQTKTRDRADAQAQQRYIQATESQAQKVSRLKTEIGSLRSGSAAYYDTLTKLTQAEQAAGRGAGGGRKATGGGGGAAKQVAAAQTAARQIGEVQISENNKALDVQTKYELQRLKITQDYGAKRVAAEQNLQQRLADTNAGFYDTLINLDNQGVAQAYDAQYQQVLGNLPQIAAEKGADVADAYLQAQEAALKAQAGRAVAIAKAEQDAGNGTGDAGRAEALRGVDALYRASEQRKIDAALNRTDTIASAEQAAQQDALNTQEQANAQLAISSDRATDKITRNAQARIDALTKEQAATSKVADGYARLAPGTASSSAPGGTATPTAPGGADPTLQGLAQIKNAIDGLGERVQAVEQAVTSAGRGVEGAVGRSSMGGPR